MNKLMVYACVFLEKKILKEWDYHPIYKYPEFLNERDTSDVWRQFIIWLLLDPDDGMVRFFRNGYFEDSESVDFEDQGYKVILQVAQLYIQNCKNKNTWKKVRENFGYTTYHAFEVAKYAADIGYILMSESRYDFPFYYIEKAAALAEDLLETAAEAEYFLYIGRSDMERNNKQYNYYKRMANKLIELLQAAPLKENP